MSTLLACRPNLEVLDLEPEVRFLCDVLGFVVDLSDEDMGLAILHRDEVSIALVRAPEPAVNDTTACYITVTEVDRLHRACVESGAIVPVPLTDHPWGLRDFVVELPGRHRLAFGQPLSDPRPPS